jgi:hypothetical protein
MTGQLSLFAGSGQRGRKPPPAKEFATHCMIADTLRHSLEPGWIWFHPANGELRDDATGAKLKRLGVKPGVSDFILIAPNGGRVHALELKRKGNRPTEAQYAFLAAVLVAGGRSAWVDGYQPAIEQLAAWGAVRARVAA